VTFNNSLRTLATPNAVFNNIGHTEQIKITNINLNSQWCKDTNKKSFNDWDYPTLDLSGIEMHWIHHQNQEEKLFQTFEKRKQRYLENKPKTIFLFNYFTLFQEYNVETFEILFNNYLKKEPRFFSVYL
jgi:hypothetical protein